jgi:hypothetical protein
MNCEDFPVPTGDAVANGCRFFDHDGDMEPL